MVVIYVYKNTTNPKIATGDGIVLYIEPEVKFLTCNTSNFTQLLCILKRDGMLFLISEAVRGDGAKLRLKMAKKFMHKYDDREELASEILLQELLITK